MEFVPHIGTRKEFMIEFRAQYELWMPNMHRDRCFELMLKLQAERIASRSEWSTRPWATCARTSTKRSRSRFVLISEENMVMAYTPGQS